MVLGCLMVDGRWCGWVAPASTRPPGMRGREGKYTTTRFDEGPKDWLMPVALESASSLVHTYTASFPPVLVWAVDVNAWAVHRFSNPTT